MTQDEIIEMARRAGCPMANMMPMYFTDTQLLVMLVAFAKLVAERALADPMREVQRLGQEIEQEPVAHCKVRPLRGDESFPKVEIDWVNQPVPGPLYATPPQRTWVGLTGEDVVKAYDDYQSGRFSAGFMGATRSIEAKLKQKNGFAEEKNQ